MADGVYEINEIIGRRITQSGKEEYLVHWKKYKVWESTWEPLENLRPCLANVAEFIHKAYPIPGLYASEILHLKPKLGGHLSQPKLKKITQVNKKKLRATHHKAILDEIMKEKAKEIDVKKERSTISRRGKKREPEVTRYVLRKDDQTVFNGQTLDKNQNCRILSSPEARHKRRRYNSMDDKHPMRAMSPRKSKDHALLAMASANMKNNHFNFLGMDEHTSEPVRTTRTHGQLQESIMVCQEGGVLKLTICNEAKQNALTIEMCEQLVAALHEASKDDVNVVVIIGAGKYFCSGLDYTCVFTRGPQQKQNTKLLVERFKLLVEVIIHCSKPIIAAVNGDAKGFGTSLVALCDIVYVCEKINLELSFTKWGHTPIGCCTYTLPQAVGHAGAYGMLLFSTKMSAEDAWMNGLASETLDSDSFTDIVSQRAKILAAMNTKCIQDTKSLLQGENQQRLKNINAEECNLLQKYLLDERGVAALATAWKEDVMG